MPGATRQVAVTTGAYVAISPTVNGYSVSVGELASVVGWPTTAFQVKKGLTQDPLVVPMGGSYTCKAGDGRRIFRPEALPGVNGGSGAAEVLFYIQAVDANTTIYVDEEGL